MSRWQKWKRKNPNKAKEKRKNKNKRAKRFYILWKSSYHRKDLYYSILWKTPYPLRRWIQLVDRGCVWRPANRRSVDSLLRHHHRHLQLSTARPPDRLPLEIRPSFHVTLWLVWVSVVVRLLSSVVVRLLLLLSVLVFNSCLCAPPLFFLLFFSVV